MSTKDHDTELDNRLDNNFVGTTKTIGGFDIEEIVRWQYWEDDFFRLTFQNPKHYKNFTIGNRVLYQISEGKRLLCIPKGKHQRCSICEIVIAEVHGILAYLGHRKTLAYLKDHVWWKTMVNDTQKYCESCMTCSRIKPSNQKPYGLLNPLNLLNIPWDSIRIDFVGPLPESKDWNSLYDCITVVIDRI